MNRGGKNISCQSNISGNKGGKVGSGGARTDTIFGGCKKHVFAAGAAVGSDQMATELICMRPLPPGVSGFAYERVALTDFSLHSLVSHFASLCSSLPYSLPFSPSIPLRAQARPTPGVRIYGLLAQRVASLTRR